MNRDDAEDLLFNEAILNRIQNSLQNTNPFDPQTIFHQPAPPNPKKRPRVMERSSYKTAKDYALGISSEQERKIVQAQNAQGYYCFLIGSYGSIASYAVRKSYVHTHITASKHLYHHDLGCLCIKYLT